LRVHRDRLLSHPDETLGAMYRFLELPATRASLRPFSSIDPDEVAFADALPSAATASATSIRTAADLSSMVLTSERSPDYPGDELRVIELTTATYERWSHGSRLAPPMPGDPPRESRPKRKGPGDGKKKRGENIFQRTTRLFSSVREKAPQ
jgi:hypothetical protein